MGREEERFVTQLLGEVRGTESFNLCSRAKSKAVAILDRISEGNRENAADLINRLHYVPRWGEQLSQVPLYPLAAQLQCRRSCGSKGPPN